MKTERPYPFVTIDARGTKRAQEGTPEDGAQLQKKRSWKLLYCFLQ